MENLQVYIDIREHVKVDVDPLEVLDAINDLPIGRKWGAISRILDGISTKEELTEEQTKLLQKFLIKQCKRFNVPISQTN